ncbi:MAG: hypothetical protein EVA65_11075 [Oceanococcus sp.]|nr:MAG: hypothetical protein EVA65_11075 [Oceanococcus sp.]
MPAMKLETRLFIADFTHLDCAWFDPLQGLIGESWRVDAELAGELADNGMLCDFGVVKSVLKQALDEQIDHRLLLNAAQAAELHNQSGHSTISLRNAASEEWHYRAPSSSFALLDTPTIDAGHLAATLAAPLRALLPDNITDLNLTLSPAHHQGPYRYCHGLRQHSGNCQRMAHGHRARLDIQVDGERHHQLETDWQQRFDGRYIGSEEHLSISGSRHRYAYQASQGAFELELPQNRSCPIEAEPTVEHITAHMARAIARQLPGRRIECRAFEGIGKGAHSCAELKPKP